MADTGIIDTVLGESKDERGYLGLASKLTGVSIPGLGLVNGAEKVWSGAGKVGDGDYGHGLLDIGTGLGGMTKDALGIAQSFGVGSGAGSLGTVIDLASNTGKFGSGMHALATDEGYGGQTCDGIHDMLAGAGGITEAIGGKSEVGQVASVFNKAFAVGDAIAPYVFHDAASKGAHTEAADGVYETTTGNADVDHIVHAVEDLGDGDYMGAAGEAAQGLPFALQMAVNPTGALATEAIEGFVAQLWE